MAAERRAQKQFERLGKLPVDRQPEASNFRCDLEELQRVADLADMSRTSLRALLNGAAKNTVQSAPQKSSSLETTRKVSISPQPTDSRLSAHHNPAPQPKAAPHAPQKANFKSSQPPENVQQTGLGKTQVPGAVRPTALTPRPALSPQDETSALRGPDQLLRPLESTKNACGAKAGTSPLMALQPETNPPQAKLLTANNGTVLLAKRAISYWTVRPCEKAIFSAQFPCGRPPGQKPETLVVLGDGPAQKG